jgi:hypothetical protein
MRKELVPTSPPTPIPRPAGSAAARRRSDQRAVTCRQNSRERGLLERLSVYRLTREHGYSGPAPVASARRAGPPRRRRCEQHPLGLVEARTVAYLGKARHRHQVAEGVATGEQRPHRGLRPDPSSTPGTGRAHRRCQDAPAQPERAARAAAALSPCLPIGRQDHRRPCGQLWLASWAEVSD